MQQNHQRLITLLITATAEVIREYVEKVIVFQAETIDGVKTQRIKIIWNCIGDFAPPVTKETEKSA